MTSILIEPIDVLFLRDGKPFSAGMDHLARSVFPPFPPTLAGFVRSKLLLDAKLDWNLAREQFGDLGNPDGYGEFRVTGLFLRKHGIDYVPVPRDVVKPKDSESYGVLRPIQHDNTLPVTSNFPERDLLHLWFRTASPVEAVAGYTSLPDFVQYCISGEAPQTITCEEHFVVREPRTEIGMNPAARTAQQGRLFTIEYLRLLDDASFHVCFDGVRWPGQSGLATFGGEQRPIRWRVLDQWEPSSVTALEEKVRASSRFKIILLAPAFFSGGWVPGQRLNQCLEKAGVEAKLVSAAVDRPVRIGGFDLHKREPKPMRLAAPAGSVYFYEIKSGDPARLVKTWAMNGISDHNWEAGMGLSMIGGWDYA
jgi:CRISPR-associated protein Cmr3